MSDTQTPSMNLIVDDARQLVQVYDFNQADWDANTIPIPDDYTLQFVPQLDDTTWNALNLGREIIYLPTVVYTMVPIDGGYMSVPTTIYVQYFLPKGTTADQAQSVQQKLAT